MSELIYKSSKLIDESVPIHIEVLLPAFVLGCVMALPEPVSGQVESQEDGHHGHAVIETPTEQRVATVIAATFMSWSVFRGR